MVDNKKINWYVAHTRVNQELWIKKKLDELGIENFLPQEEQVRETPLGRKTIRVLLIHGMIFIHTDKATSFSLINDHGLNIVYLKDIEGRHSLIVPDKQMHDFMFLLDFHGQGRESDQCNGGFQTTGGDIRAKFRISNRAWGSER